MAVHDSLTLAENRRYAERIKANCPWPRKPKKATQAEIKAAREIHHKAGMVEVDDDANVSHASNGYWGAAWVRVPA